MLGYLFLLGIMAFASLFVDLQLDDHISNPLVNYFVFLPFALILLWGKYRLLRDVQSDDAQH